MKLANSLTPGLLLAEVLFSTVTFSGCAVFSKKVELSEQGKGSAPQTVSQGQVEIAVLGFNDFHGYLDPVVTQGVSAGGAAMLASHIKVHKEKLGNRLLILDGGDQFQGTIESNTFYGQSVVDFFNYLGLNGAAIGNHEFDFGQEVLKTRMQQAHYPYLSANTRLKKEKLLPDFPNTLPSKIYDLGPAKIGVIGLTTRDTPYTTRAVNVADLEFTDLVDATLREREKLKNAGATVFVVVAHVGTRCRDFGTGQSLTHTPTSNSFECDEKGELSEFLKKLPKGSIDAIVAGHTHTVLHHFIEGIPVIEAGAYNRYYNMIRMVYDTRTQSVVQNQTRIEGPIPVCEKVYLNQKDCDVESKNPPEKRGPLVMPMLYGKTLTPDPGAIELLKPYREKTDAVKKRIVGEAVQAISHDRRNESELGNLMADALRWKAGADFSLVNPGGVRAPIDQGPITYEEVFRSFPFDNRVALLKVTGAELKRIFRSAQNGSRGWFSFSGLTLKTIALDRPGQSKDLNHDGKLDPWEVDRVKEFKDVKTGKKIRDDKIYTLATLDFLVTGGDGLEWAMKQVPSTRIQLDTGTLVRDALIDYLALKGPVNSSTAPLVNPQSRRIHIVLK